jgi:hypothetical protein
MNNINHYPNQPRIFGEFYTGTSRKDVKPDAWDKMTETATTDVLAAESCLAVASGRDLTVWETVYVALGSVQRDWLIENGLDVPACPLLTALEADHPDFCRVAVSAFDAIREEVLGIGFTARAAYCAATGMSWDDYYAAYSEWYDARVSSSRELRPAPLMDAVEDRMMDDDYPNC